MWKHHPSSGVLWTWSKMWKNPPGSKRRFFGKKHPLGIGKTQEILKTWSRNLFKGMFVRKYTDHHFFEKNLEGLVAFFCLPRSEPEKDTGMPPAESLVDVYFFWDSDKHCDDG